MTEKQTKRTKKLRWLVFFALLLIFSVWGLFTSEPKNMTYAPSGAVYAEEAAKAAENIDFADVAWMITASGLVMLMTPGLSLFYGGMVRPKNVISTMVQSIVSIGLVSVLWVVVGFSLAFGNSWHGLIGNPWQFFMFQNVGASPNGIGSEIKMSDYVPVTRIDGAVVPDTTFDAAKLAGGESVSVVSAQDAAQAANGGKIAEECVITATKTGNRFFNYGVLGLSIPLVLYALFQMKFAIITPALITGSFAERVHFSGYLVFMTLFTIFIYAPLAHWTWHPDGLLAWMGVRDFAGGIVVHASSGVAALAGALYLGRRVEPGEHSPANIPLVLLGACLLWFGWFGFNGGSFLRADAGAVKAFLNTNTASAAAMLTWFLLDAVLGRKPSAMGVAVGAVAGLVGITPCAGWVTAGVALFIGTFIAIVCNTMVHWRAQHPKLDDALDVFSTHGVGGIVGTILTGFFVGVLVEHGGAMAFWMHVLGISLVFVYSFVVSLLLYWVTDKLVNMRVSAAHERLGLDRSQHGEHYGIVYEDDEHELRESAEAAKAARAAYVESAAASNEKI